MATLFDQLLPPDPRPYSAYAPIRARAARRSGGPAAALDRRAREAEIDRIARQLAVVSQTVPWGRVQDDAWDGLSRFVYRLRSAASVRAEAERVAGARGLDPTAVGHYALRRWFCFGGARIELEFVALFPEQYQLVIPRTHYESPKLAPLLAILRDETFAAQVEALGGYDVADMGKVVWQS